MKQLPTLVLLFRHRGSKRGIALISVLAMVVLLTAIVVAFMMRAGSERVATGYYRASADVRTLADTTINLVQGQINEATGQGNTTAWASQPGAIRLYDDSGNATKVFRLYSAPTLTSTVSGNDCSFLSTDVPASGWASSPATWVDLNAPVNTDPSATATTPGAASFTHFPILDPRDTTTLANTLSTLDGFSLTGAPVESATTSYIDANLTKNPAPMPVRWLYVLQNGYLASPVGTGNVVTFPSVTGVADTICKPSKDNPIVGRIAYWTDDETCKVNINTAAGDGVISSGNPTTVANATFWSTPYFSAFDDGCLAAYQPAQGEFQRYPGHPATVALNSVLKGLGWDLNFKAGTNPQAGSSTSDGGSPDFYSILPRYGYGGSMAATVNANVVSGAAYALAVPLPGNRLYPTVDEMLFNPARALNTDLSTTSSPKQLMETARFFLTAHSRAPELNLFGLPRVSMWPVSTHIIDSDPSQYCTAIDQLLAFTSSIGQKSSANYYPYYFTRLNPRYSYGANSDINITRNTQLLTYLDTLCGMKVPGLGGTMTSKYQEPGTRQILTEMFDYIRLINIFDGTLFTAGKTTYGGATGGSYNGAAWVEPGGINDGINQVAPTYYSTWGTAGIGNLPRLNEVAIHFIGMGSGGVPAVSGGGFGGDTAAEGGININPQVAGSSAIKFLPGDSSSTLSYGADIANTGTAPYPAPGPSPLAPTTGPYNQIYLLKNSKTNLTDGIVPDNTTAVQAFIYLSFTNPCYSNMPNSGTNCLWVEIKQIGSNGFQLNGHDIGLPIQDDMRVGCNGGWMGGGGLGYVGIISNFGNNFLGQGEENLPDSNNTGARHYPFYSGILPISCPNASVNTNMAFTGGTLLISIYDGANSRPLAGKHAAKGNLIQTYTLTFDNATIPVPLVVPGTVGFSTGAQTTGPIVGEGTPSNKDSSGNPTIWPAAVLDQDGWNTLPWIDRWNKPQHYAYGSNFINSTNDTILSMVLSNTWSDPRIMCAAPSTTMNPFVKHIKYGISGNRMAHNMFYSAIFPFPGNTTWGSLVALAGYSHSLVSGLYHTGYYPVVSSSVAGAAGNPSGSTWTAAAPNAAITGVPIDFDNGMGNYPDGPWINMPDEGSLYGIQGSSTSNANLPYYGAGTAGLAKANGNGVVASDYATAVNFFSPNRQIPSPVMFGSLPTGVDLNATNPKGWQTLLFRPGPKLASGGTATAHKGEGSPYSGPPYTTLPDHFFLDLFWMPVSEPYAISEPFSTAGKVNLNYQIVPFTYIKRSTALRAVLASEKIAEVPVSKANVYKLQSDLGGMTSSYGAVAPKTARYPINLDATTAQFDTKFSNWTIFRSASQICEELLVPLDGNYSSASTFGTAWYDTSAASKFALVGDNVRERPYADIYSRVTTKSNTFTVYYRVQSLKNPPSQTNQAQWDETKGVVTGEYRGSTTLERFIDVNEPGIPDYASQSSFASGSNGDTMEKYYKWRVVENHQFAP